MTRCGSCGDTVPAGAFCGRCGAQLGSGPGYGPKWLRLKQFTTAPNQSVLRPALVSTLFPVLSRRSGRTFQAGLTLAIVSLTALALLRVTPALIAVGALGIPLLFVLYLRECGAFHHIPGRLLTIAAAVGAVLGIVGMLLTGELVAHSYDIPVTAGMAVTRYVRHGIAIPLAAALLKVLPALVARALSRPPRETLDGFAIGALGALAFCVGATLTRLAPQFATGTIAHQRALEGLLIEAGIAGVTVPLTAAAAGGTVGLALWFTPAPDDSVADRRRARRGLAALAVAIAVIFTGAAVVDVAGLGQLTIGLMHLGLMSAAVVVLRLALQIALLHGAAEPAPEHPGRCGWCDGMVAGVRFCPACGSALATSSAGRRTRTPVGPLLGTWTLGNALLALVLIGLSLIVTAKPHQYRCPPDCGRPPIGTPVTDLPRYVASDGAFSVAYPAPDTSYQVTTDAAGVTARWTAGDGGVLRLFAEPARGRDPRAVAVELLRRKFPDARIAYEIPNAMVGYQLGYGAAADRWPQSSTGSFLRLRILVLVAVKNDLALVAAAVGPHHEFGPDFGPGPPSAANLQIAQDMGKYVNSFRWKGDPLD